MFARAAGAEGEVAAVDASADQLAVARSHAEADGHGNIHYVHASAYDTGLLRDLSMAFTAGACSAISFARLMRCAKWRKSRGRAAL
jgi:hypothetical protein